MDSLKLKDMVLELVEELRISRVITGADPGFSNRGGAKYLRARNRSPYGRGPGGHFIKRFVSVFH